MDQRTVWEIVEAQEEQNRRVYKKAGVDNLTDGESKLLDEVGYPKFRRLMRATNPDRLREVAVTLADGQEAQREMRKRIREAEAKRKSDKPVFRTF